ncbi:MAG: DUF6933 domain-containing protein [Acidobacteriota bacterium]
MLTIQCAKRLAQELNMNVSKEQIADKDPLYSWHAYLFLINRRKCVLIMNNKTRYNFVLYGLKKADFMHFSQLVIESIAENLAADGIDQETIDKYISYCGEVRYTAASERSIIGQTNEMRFAAEMYIKTDKEDGCETDLFELNRYLNHFVMLKLPETYSRESMIKALKGL